MTNKNQLATILVVDDNPENIDVLSGVLSSRYRIKAALNGHIAIKIANATPKPDLILLDVMMPSIDGYEVCKKLKQDPMTSKIPVIFVTAKTSQKDEEYGFSLGAADYITKPISPPLVLARIKAQLSLYDQSRHMAIKVAHRMRAEGMNIEIGMLEATIEENIAYGKKEGIGGIMNFMSKEDVALINLETEERQSLDVKSLMEER
jgi:CheY-like chemotaxis protein